MTHLSFFSVKVLVAGIINYYENYREYATFFNFYGKKMTISYFFVLTMKEKCQVFKIVDNKSIVIVLLLIDVAKIECMEAGYII